MPTKKKTYPMLEKIDLANVPQDVLSKLFDFLNGATTALAIAEATGRYADFIQGVTTGEKVAASILIARDKAGKFTRLAELQAVAYFTEDKLKTLVAVFHVEAGIWKLPTPTKSPVILEDYSSKALPKEPTVVAVEEPALEPVTMMRQNDPLPENEASVLEAKPAALEPIKEVNVLEIPAKDEPRLIRALEPTLEPLSVLEPVGPDPKAVNPNVVNPTVSAQPPTVTEPTQNPIPPMPVIPSKEPPTSGDPKSGGEPTSGGDTSTGDPVKGGGGGVLGGKQVPLDLTLIGRLANATPKVSFKGYANELAFVSANPLGKGVWRIMFKSNFTGGAPAVPLRLDFEEGGIHVLAVVANWNPLVPAPLYVRL